MWLAAWRAGVAACSTEKRTSRIDRGIVAFDSVEEIAGCTNWMPSGHVGGAQFKDCSVDSQGRRSWFVLVNEGAKGTTFA